MRMKTLMAAAAVVTLTFTGASIAQADPTTQRSFPEVETTDVVSDSCVDQVTQLAADQGFNPDDYLKDCEAKVTIVSDPEQDVDEEEATALAKAEGLSRSETNSLVAAAAAGKIKAKGWEHTYWGGTIWEKHKGTTYYDGSKAWVSSYRGKTGSHECHAAGSWSVGFTISSLSCNKPGPASSADSKYKFDVGMVVKNSPVNFTVELHNKYTAAGARSTWQVGG